MKKFPKIELLDSFLCLPGKKEAIQRILSSDDVYGIDDLAIEFGGPEAGWLDFYFKVKGKKPFLFSASDVYPPFPDIRTWLENLMLHPWTFPSHSVVVDCESYHVVLSYEYIGTIKRGKDYQSVALIQMADDIAEEDRDEDYANSLQLVVPAEVFVSRFYCTLKDYIYANRKVFWKNWNLPNCNWFEFRPFIRSVESKKIEEYLKETNVDLK